MRIAVVGGGGAGLGCAWLLESAGHDVALFERSPRLGGHVRTIQVEAPNGAAIPVEVGFRFFSRAGWPRFVRLLRHLQVGVEEYDQTLTFHDRADGWTVPLPPTGSLRRWASLLRPRTRATLLEFKRLLDLAAPLVADGSWETSLGEALDGWGIDAAVQRDFVLPYVASGWGLPVDEAPALSARNALGYTCKNRPTGLGSSRWLDVRGGLEGYVRALAASLQRTDVRCGERATVRRLARGADGWSVETAAGAAAPFDQVVLACSAEDAARLIAPLDGAGSLCGLLRDVEYFDARVVLHRDRALLPPRRVDWSCVQLMRDGNTCMIHEWKGRRHGADLFRSWIVDPGKRPAAESVVHSAEYRHAKPTPRYFAVQAALERHQGREGLWFAGLWTSGADSHESALDSAVRIAEALAPDGERLRELR